MMGDETQDVTIDAQDHDIERFTQTGRAARDAVEHRLNIRW